MADVFISYSSKDRQKATKLVSELKKREIQYWIDFMDIPKGAEYDDLIPSAIAECNVVIMLISQNSMASEHVKKELRIANHHKKTIIPFMLEKVTLQDAFIYHIEANSRIIAYNNWDIAVSDLIGSLGSSLPDTEIQETVSEATIMQIDYSGERVLYAELYDGIREIRCPHCHSKYLVHECERITDNLLNLTNEGKLGYFIQTILYALAGIPFLLAIGITILGLEHLIPTYKLVGVSMIFIAVIILLWLIYLLILVVVNIEQYFAYYQISKQDKTSRIYYDRRYTRTLRCMECNKKYKISIPLKEQNFYRVFMYGYYDQHEIL